MEAHPRSTGSRRWLASGWLDVEFYEAVRGQAFSDAADAAADFVGHGMRERLSPHPSVHFATLPAPARKAWRNGRSSAVLAHLNARDPRSDPRRRDRLVMYAKALNDEPDAPPDVDWGSVARRARRPGGIAVAVLADDPRRTIRVVTSVLDGDDRDLEVLVLVRGAPAHAVLSLHEAFLDHAAVEVVRLPGGLTPADAWDAGILRASAEKVVLLAPGVVVRRGALSALVAALEVSDVAAVQPVVLDSDDTIASVGLAVTVEGAEPVPLLLGHPAEDARSLEGLPLAGTSAEALALRIEDVAAAGGLASGAPGGGTGDLSGDLAVRLLERRPGGFRVASAARVSSVRPPEEQAVLAAPAAQRPAPGMYERTGFALGPAGQVLARRPDHPGQRRWSIRLPSPPGALGDLWGDTHFGEALGEALRGLGEDVVTRRRGAAAEGSDRLDDISLALRGLFPIPPVPGKVNVLWVISHPDAVDPAELAGYDHVFAASAIWSARLEARTGRRVVPLFQASRFGLSAATQPRSSPGSSVVFVGTAGNGRARPLVRMALEAGVPLVVYGPGWHDLPDGVWRGDYIDNQRLADLYRQSGIVLADHWPDMARQGFIANRVFDAVACGARVLCDDVAGVHQVFDSQDVAVVRNRSEMLEAFDRFCRTERPDDLPRPDLTFDDRARTLVAEVSRR